MNSLRIIFGRRRYSQSTLRAAAAVSALLATSWADFAWAAEHSGSIRLAGHVQPRGAIWLSQTSFGFGGRVAVGQRIWLTDLLLSGNKHGFKVSLLSRNIDETGRVSLIDAETGATVPYQVTYGGEQVDLSRGDATLLKTKRGEQVPAAPMGLELELPANANLTGGRFEERLLLVISAP